MKVLYEEVSTATPTAPQGTMQWKAERRQRLTSSNFGRVCKMRARTKPANTVKSLLYSTFNGNSATQYGLDSEKETEAKYSEHIKGLGVSEIDISHPGLTIIPEAPELAASPDGLVCVDPGTSGLPREYIVEYKNLKSLIDKKLSVDEAITNVPGFALELSPNGYSLKRNHDFYYQIQGAMKATNVIFCHLVLCSYNSMAVVDIHFDAQFWASMNPKLRKFYMCALLPELAHPLYQFNGLLRPDFYDYNFHLFINEP